MIIRTAVTALLLGALSAPAVRAQDAPPETPESVELEAVPTPLAPADAPAAMLASVNGQGITSQDVLVEARGLYFRRDPDPAQKQAALVNLAQEILLSEEARRLGLELTDLEVDEWLRLIFGELPDLSALAEITGTTVETQRARFRRSVLSRLYVEHRIGRGGRYVRLIPADPSLSRLVEVTPRELKRAFQERKAALAVPPELSWRVLAFETLAQANEAVLALSLGRDELPPTLTDRVDVVPEPEVTRIFASIAPEIGTWLLGAEVGEVSSPFVLESAAVIFHIQERSEGREADFAEDQNLLRQQMVKERMQDARQMLILDEARKAVVWPADLLSAPPPPPKPPKSR